MTVIPEVAAIVNRIYATIDNQDSWINVLEDITKSIGAVATIITLRDAKTAKVVITPQIETELQSPLIACLDADRVDHYVKHLRQTDPWAKAQSQIHPYIPTLMSDVMPLPDLAQTDFWPWARGQGINDTLVVEIDKTPNHWTAFNIFFWNDGAGKGAEVLELVKAILPDLKRAWAAGRKQVQASILEAQLISGVKADQRAVFLLNPQGQVVAKSQTATTQLISGIGRVDRKSKRLSFVKNLEITADIAHFVDLGPNELAMADFLEVVAMSSKITVLSTGEFTGFTLLELRKKTTQHHIPWEDPKLNKRQQLAVRTVAETNRIGQVGLALGVSERYGRTIFKQAQHKLDGISKADLVLLRREQDDPS